MKAAMVLEHGQNRLVISILDYNELKATNRDGRNTLLTSLELRYDGKLSIVTAPLLSTYELLALANWFEQLAVTNRSVAPIVLLEPCLFFNCSERNAEHFRITVRMEAEASPTWTKYYAEPFELDFLLIHQQMLEAAKSLRRIHVDFPTQS